MFLVYISVCKKLQINISAAGECVAGLHILYEWCEL
jgi:hypothetical protein